MTRIFKALPFAFQKLEVLDFGVRPAHVLHVRSAGLTTRPPIQSLKSFGYILGTLLLTGCSSYRERFDCPIGAGLTCASLSEVNEKIDRHDLNLDFSSKKSQASCSSCQKTWWRSDLVRPTHPRIKGS